METYIFFLISFLYKEHILKQKPPSGYGGLGTNFFPKLVIKGKRYICASFFSAHLFDN